MDDLLAKSDDIGEVSKMFHSQAKKNNQWYVCCDFRSYCDYWTVHVFVFLLICLAASCTERDESSQSTDGLNETQSLNRWSFCSFGSTVDLDVSREYR